MSQVLQYHEGNDRSGRSLSGHEFPVNLNHTGSNFNGCDLTNADFNGCDLTNADFSGADLSGATFVGANLSRCEFNGARVTGADFTGAEGAQVRDLQRTANLELVYPEGTLAA